jgi:hypothetical protein
MIDLSRPRRWHGYLGGKPRGDVRDTIAFTLEEGKQPNWFHRLMQYLILGIYWKREPFDGDRFQSR